MHSETGANGRSVYLRSGLARSVLRAMRANSRETMHH
jgi:hypothetical protein